MKTVLYHEGNNTDLKLQSFIITIIINLFLVNDKNSERKANEIQDIKKGIKHSTNQKENPVEGNLQINTERKVSVFGVFLVHIFPHSD